MNKKIIWGIVIVVIAAAIILVVSVWKSYEGYDDISPEARKLMALPKTYTNEKYGFSFQYPSNITIASKCGYTGTLILECATIAAPIKSERSITVFVNSTTNLIDSNWFSAAEITAMRQEVVNAENWTILRLKVNKGGPTQEITTALIVKDSITVNITGDQTLIDYILPTFKFIGTTTLMADWKMYTNEKYGFSIKYPSDWVIKEYTGNSTKNSLDVFEPIFSVHKNGPIQARCHQEACDGAELYVLATSSYSSELDQWSTDLSINASDIPEKFIAYDLVGFLKVRNGIDESIPGTWEDEHIHAYKRLPNGNVIGIAWQRTNFLDDNDLSYQKYLLPILSTFTITN